MFARALSVAAVLSVFATSAAAADCTRTYTVVAGDICDSISASHNVSTYQLAAINPAIDAACANLVPGSTLCLGTANEDCAATYVVRADDTCEAIAAAHAVNATLLALNNPQIDAECSNIYVGEVLCVGTAVQVPPVPTSGIPAVTIPATAMPANPTTVVVASSSTLTQFTLTSTLAPSTTASASATTDADDDEDNIPWDQLPFCDDEE